MHTSLGGRIVSQRTVSQRTVTHRAHLVVAYLAQAAVLFGLAACSEDAADHKGNHDQVARSEAAVLEAAVFEATVLEVIDGDTVRLDLDGSRESVRLIGVNTPETKHPTKGVECFGPEASAFLARWLQPGTRVRVERDLEARDAYRRLLLYVFVDTSAGQRFVNLELVARDDMALTLLTGTHPTCRASVVGRRRLRRRRIVGIACSVRWKVEWRIRAQPVRD